MQNFKKYESDRNKLNLFDQYRLTMHNLAKLQYGFARSY